MEVFSVFVGVSRLAVTMYVCVRPRWHGVVQVGVVSIVVRMPMLVGERLVDVAMVVPFATV